MPRQCGIYESIIVMIINSGESYFTGQVHAESFLDVISFWWMQTVCSSFQSQTLVSYSHDNFNGILRTALFPAERVKLYEKWAFWKENRCNGNKKNEDYIVLAQYTIMYLPMEFKALVKQGR